MKSSLLTVLVLATGLVTTVRGASTGGWNPGLPSPSKVVDPPHEESLANVILTEKAVERLAIKTVAIETGTLPRRQLYGGQVMFPLGAPEPGTITEVQPPDTPAAITALIQSQITADAAVKIARVEVEAAGIALRREEKLLAVKTGTAQAVDDAKARAERAAVSLEAAQAQRKFLGRSLVGVNLQGKVWLRVPVYAGDVARLDRSAKIKVNHLAARGDSTALIAEPVAGIPTASTNGVTVDWYYEIDNASAGLVPGQRLAARLIRRDVADGLLVPWSAILHDIHGGTWVYEQLAATEYVRRRVEVAYVKDGRAVLTRGPKAGTKVVTDGAIELFGTEFGIGK